MKTPQTKFQFWATVLLETDLETGKITMLKGFVNQKKGYDKKAKPVKPKNIISETGELIEL